VVCGPEEGGIRWRCYRKLVSKFTVMKDCRFGTEHVVEKWGKRAHARRVLTLVAGSSKGGGVTCAGIGNAGTSIMMFKNQLSVQKGLPTPNDLWYRTGPGVHTGQPGACSQRASLVLNSTSFWNQKVTALKVPVRHTHTEGIMEHSSS
jgi:hypothetical protein